MGGFPVSHENSGLTWFWYETLIKIVIYLQFGDFVSQWIDVGELSMWTIQMLEFPAFFSPNQFSANNAAKLMI